MIFYMTEIKDSAWTPAKIKNRFSMPVVAAKPIVEDDCGNGDIMLHPFNENSGEFLYATNDTWYEF